MQAAQHVVRRARVVVLDEVDLAAGRLFKFALVEAFKEEAALVAEHARLEQNDFRYGKACRLHQNTVSFRMRSKYWP
jgi:hypothetical protein